jgi:drug/metabolite transporter (DMT)-like permease
VSQAAIYTYLVPVISAAMSYVWLGEHPSTLFVLGAGVVLLGVALAHPSELAMPAKASSSQGVGKRR